MDEGTQDRILEIVASMKSNVGSKDQWIKELEYSVGVAQATATILTEIRNSQDTSK